MDEHPENKEKSQANAPDSKQDNTPVAQIAKEHEAIRALFGLDKTFEERGHFESDHKSFSVRGILVIAISLAVIAGCVLMWFWFEYEIRAQEEARYIAEHERKLAEEEARRNRVEYADIAFLDSFPPAVAITMDGKQLYARSQDGSYSELRARESTWINNLAVKEDTIFRFGFEAEGFKPLTRTIAYYDWFPTNKPGANPLQKVFRKIVLEPDITPVFSECAQLPKILDTDPCEWSIFREIVFREKYIEATQNLAVEDGIKRRMLKHLLTHHPELAQAARGFDMAVLDSNGELLSPDLPDSTKSLLNHLMAHPYALYGTITIETDSPDTRVFFMSEPLMVVKASGSMSQVRINPDEPYTFAVYGQGKPIEIGEKLSLRLETNNAPAYITEIMPHQWHCSVPPIAEALDVPAPEIPPELMMPDYRHQLCSYSIKISVKFNDIRAIESDAAKQRAQNQEAKPTEP